jgi:DNA topoisomerase-2
MLTASVAETSAYHHGDTSLSEAIINLARDFVGSNNLNLLEPIGQFGTRRVGGEDAAGSRYICTKPASLTDLVFRPEDRPVLKYLEDDGMSVEPEYYVPILPFVLINGASGIGTGFSTNVPSYNPLAITRLLINSYEKLDGFDKLIPWHRGFKGATTDKKSSDESSVRYMTHGIFERTGPKTIKVTELPVFVWTENFKILLEAKIASGRLSR